MNVAWNISQSRPSMCNKEPTEVADLKFYQRVSPHIRKQTVDVPTPQDIDETVEVATLTSHERGGRIEKQTINVPFPQDKEETANFAALKIHERVSEHFRIQTIDVAHSSKAQPICRTCSKTGARWSDVLVAHQLLVRPRDDIQRRLRKLSSISFGCFAQLAQRVAPFVSDIGNDVFR